jgi:hypothetical protein
MSDVNVVWGRAGVILSNGINKYFLCGFLWPHFGNLIVTLCMHTAVGSPGGDIF